MTTRKDFLAAGAFAAVAPVAVGAAPLPAASPKATPSPKSFEKLNFDLQAFNALLDREASHKHLFASINIDSGEVLSAMRNTVKAYGDIGTPLADVFPVAVLYHGASIAIGFDDAMWNQYFLPLARKSKKRHWPAIKDFQAAIDPKTKGNPFLKKQGGEWDYSIPSLIADAGAHFFVCNNAAHGFAGVIADELALKADDVYRNLSFHLVANAMLVPAGVWAVHAVQEHRFSLLQTSL